MARYKSIEAQKNFNKYKQNYNNEHYERISLNMPKGSKQLLQEYAKTNDKSVNKLILDLLKENLIL